MSDLGALPPDFDFWIGSWDCTWDGGFGANTITRDLGGQVLVERFETETPEPFTGMSLTAFDRRRRRWLQGWADSAGNFWSFVGGPEGNRVVLTTVPAASHEDDLKRMVFSDITRDSLEWNWERSDDGGQTWQSLWQIKYARKADSS
jgi:hypothetical protein